MFGKLWRAIKAQFNKMANFFWRADPIAQMQLEYDEAVQELKAGREGLAQYRALVERVGQQVDKDQETVNTLSAKVKAFLQAGDRETAARYALQLKQAQGELKENQTQLDMHEKAYQNNLTKIKHASSKLGDLKEKISKYDAELKMSRAEAELAKVSEAFNVDITTDFGQVEEMVQDEINLNRAKARVTSDLSGEGIEDIEKELAMEKALAEDALKEFEVDMGLITPQTSPPGEQQKDLGPQTQKET